MSSTAAQHHPSEVFELPRSTDIRSLLRWVESLDSDTRAALVGACVAIDTTPLDGRVRGAAGLAAASWFFVDGIFRPARKRIVCMPISPRSLTTLRHVTDGLRREAAVFDKDLDLFEGEEEA